MPLAGREGSVSLVAAGVGYWPVKPRHTRRTQDRPRAGTADGNQSTLRRVGSPSLPPEEGFHAGATRPGLAAGRAVSTAPIIRPAPGPRIASQGYLQLDLSQGCCFPRWSASSPGYLWWVCIDGKRRTAGSVAAGYRILTCLPIFSQYMRRRRQSLRRRASSIQRGTPAALSHAADGTGSTSVDASGRHPAVKPPAKSRSQ